MQSEQNGDKNGANNGSSEQPGLTTRQGHPVVDNQNVRTVGERGPTTLENYHFIEKITHFDRERIPERVVHARGAGAHGYFEAYGTVGGEPVVKYTRAKLFQQKGKRTPVFVRFSSVIHGGHSPETLHQFAIEEYLHGALGEDAEIHRSMCELRIHTQVETDPVHLAGGCTREVEAVQRDPGALIDLARGERRFIGAKAVRMALFDQIDTRNGDHDAANEGAPVAKRVVRDHQRVRCRTSASWAQ